MNRPILIYFFILLSTFVFSQVDSISTLQQNSVRNDPFFNEKDPVSSINSQPIGANEKNGEKIKHIHSDILAKDKDLYDGNMYFTGNVIFEHKGSRLEAEKVILYEQENYIRATGGVKLINADGSIITANEMEYDGRTQRGIAKGNVVMRDPKQTIETETLYYDRLADKAYYTTGAVITSEGSSTYSKRGSYHVASRTINLSGNIKIDNDQYTVEGSDIIQDQNSNTATFTGPTTITNRKNPNQYLYTENGKYLMNTKEAYLNRNSRIHYNDKILSGNSLYFNQLTGFGKGEGNIVLDDPTENRFIRGEYGEIYEKQDSAMISNNAYAMKVLKNDSIYFSAEKIIAYQKQDSTPVKKSFLRAFYQARLFKSNAQARGDSLSFNETDGIMYFTGNPMLWSGAKQVSGNKIEAYFNTQTENIDSLKVIGNAIAISKVDSLNNKDEFNQIKGRLMTIHYQDSEIKQANVIGNAQAITYADDKNEQTNEVERIGISLSTCGIIEALFIEQNIEIISCSIGALTDIYPMSKIAHEKRFFTDFNWNTTDRLKKWQDIFVDSPNHPAVEYIADNTLFDRTQKELEKKKTEEEAKKPKRERR